ncbi:MAG TPA: hypothetical protein PLT40_10635 [Ilumatobacteraceae bacterium]|jgi:hypothetical protein|nr:hypothetical protein [Ilumatobacteraceae bacterium]
MSATSNYLTRLAAAITHRNDTHGLLVERRYAYNTHTRELARAQLNLIEAEADCADAEQVVDELLRNPEWSIDDDA